MKRNKNILAIIFLLLSTIVVAQKKSNVPEYEKGVKELVNTGEEHLDIDEYDQAIKYLTQADKLQPKHPEISYLLGKVYIKIKRPDKAVSYLQVASDANYDEKTLNLELGLACQSVNKFDEAIVTYVRRHHGSLIGEATAERIKTEIGCAYPLDEILELDVRGRNLAEGVPRSFTLNSNEVLEALQEPLSAIVSAIRSALEQSPPELAADISERGVVLTGGGSLLRNLDRLISEETSLPVIVAEDPLTCVARGGGKALELMDERGFDLFVVE